MSIQVSTPWAEILGFAILFGVVLLFLAIELWRPPRPPAPASGICDLMQATDIWGDPSTCGCHFTHGPGTDPAWEPCPAHELLAEWERHAEREMRAGEGSGL